MQDRYTELRQEYNTSAFRSILHENLGSICINCGSNVNIEYHHIVPLALGGTNKLSNIVPLCKACHTASHHGRHILKYRKKPKKTGRPIIHGLDENKEAILWDWAKGRIGTKECKILLELTKSTKIKDTKMYKDFIEKFDIQNIKNTLDVVVANGNLVIGRNTSVIIYKNGNIENCEYRRR